MKPEIDLNKPLYALTIDKILHTNGHKPIVAVCNNFKPYVLKNAKGIQPPITVINEFIALYLLSQWDLPYFPGARVQADVDIIPFDKMDSQYHKPSFYDDQWLFGSEYHIEFDNLNDLLISSTRKYYNQIENPNNILRLGLFDLWVQNDDRHGENYNILFFKSNTEKIQLKPIDHGFIFESISYQNLNPESFSPSWNQNIFDSKLGKLIKNYHGINREYVRGEETYFAECVSKSASNFSIFVDNLSKIYPTLSKEDKTNIYQYLFDVERNKKVFKEFLNHLYS